MIGVFDSGYGGLTILSAIIKKLPQYSYLYLGDNARAPYGPRSAEEITEFTWQGVEYLFKQGCPLVILACNTASAAALRTIQQQLLPRYERARLAEAPPQAGRRRVLGIIVPTIEQISANTRTVGVLGTEATIDSHVYVDAIKKLHPHVTVIQQSCPKLVPLIEEGSHPAETTPVIKQYLDQLFAQNSAIDTVVLACSHYSLIKDLIRQQLPPSIKIFDQPGVVATSLADYLDRHPEITARLDQTGRREFVTTGDAQEVSDIGSGYLKELVRFTNIR